MLAWDLFSQLSGVAVAVALALYLIPALVLSLALGSQNLREKYGEWALVTGGSSGIGLALVRKLAAQGINVCVLALDDKYFEPSMSALRSEYPKVQFRPIQANLAGNPEVYMKAISDAIQDIRISILINNAGFMLMGYFDERPIDQLAGNIECNTVAALRITHLVYSKMIEDGKGGCLAFTSSASHFIPAPYAAVYAATKSMLSSFAVSLSIEARNHNVDVCVVHPSYTHTNLYEKNPKLPVLDVLSKMGWTPDDVANVMLASVGRVVVRDAGAYSISTNILGRLIDPSTLAACIMPFRGSMGPPPKARVR